jgi:hypothetical protein
MNKAFTMIEVTVALFLLVVGGGGAFALINQTTSLSSIGGNQLKATYMAQEGIEAIRNARDTNYLKNNSWDTDIAGDCSSFKISPCDFYGDVNMDGIVTDDDATLIAEYGVGIVDLTEEQINRGNVIRSGDNIGLDINDALHVARYAVCSLDDFPVCRSAKFIRSCESVVIENEMTINCQTSWENKGNYNQVEIQTKLYNWK